ncbi:MAG: hypothetical protein H7335_17070 [Massilia sp.]|nr:hypothetical protein [Massilia sp.]
MVIATLRAAGSEQRFGLDQARRLVRMQIRIVQRLLQLERGIDAGRKSERATPGLGGNALENFESVHGKAIRPLTGWFTQKTFPKHFYWARPAQFKVR